MTQEVKNSNTGFFSIFSRSNSSSTTPEASISDRASVQLQLDAADAPASNSLNSYVIQPIKDFARSLQKGDPKAVVTLLVGLTALKYIAAQQSVTAATLAAGQVATTGLLLGPQGLALLGVIATAGLVIKSTQAVMNYRQQNIPQQSAQQPEAPQAATVLEQVQRGIQNGATVAIASVGVYAGRRMQIEGEARFEAGLAAMDLSPGQEKAVRVASATLPAAVGASATYIVLRKTVDISPKSALTVAGALGLAELGRRGFNYYTRAESDAVRVARTERAQALKAGTTTPIWEMTTGIMYDTAGTSVDIASNSILQNKVGAYPTLGIRTATHTLADRHSLQYRGQEPSMTSGVYSSLGSNLVSYLTA